MGVSNSVIWPPSKTGGVVVKRSETLGSLSSSRCPEPLENIFSFRSCALIGVLVVCWDCWKTRSDCEVDGKTSGSVSSRLGHSPPWRLKPIPSKLEHEAFHLA